MSVKETAGEGITAATATRGDLGDRLDVMADDLRRQASAFPQDYPQRARWEREADDLVLAAATARRAARALHYDDMERTACDCRKSQAVNILRGDA